MNKKIFFDDLPQEEQDVLTQIYGAQSGYTAKKISYVQELEEDEEYYFDKNVFQSPNFFVQRLYKVSGNLVPLKFNLAVSKLIEQTDELRTNFCSVGTRTLKIIFESRKEIPEIIYRNLENVADIDETLKNILEADMRKSFDLRHDKLIRLSVFHTGEKEYAILITLPQLTAESFEAKNLFRSALGMELIPSSKKEFVATENIEPIINYWSKIFSNLPAPATLPFEKKFAGLNSQKSYRLTIPAAIMSDLREKSNSNKIMLMSIFQSAWAILLQEVNHSHDTAFSVLIADKNTKDIKSIPVRFETDDESTLAALTNKQFKQMIISRPYACKDFSAIKKILQPQAKNFDHFLSFGDFLEEEYKYSTANSAADGILVQQNSWNGQNTKLGIYFHYKENTTSITILYDANRFAENFGILLAQRYSLIIQQMILDWNLPYENFMARLTERLQFEPSSIENDAKYLLQFISQLSLLQGREGTLQTLLKMAKLTTYFEGDRISASEMENKLIFVAEGKLVRSLDAGDGWYNTLDIVKENSWINETVLLPKRKAKMSAEVLTEKAVLMTIPLEDMQKFLKTEFGIENKILMHVLAEMEKYQRLWINS